ncbi:MAG: hypothetical protein J6D39_07665 [Niameybacter sp.]|nr:hypothetical protein [Niameybacter sp.]
MIHFRQVKKEDEIFVAEKKGKIIDRALNKKDGFTQDNGEVCSRCDISMRRRL